MDYVIVLSHRSGMLSLSDRLFRKSIHAALHNGDLSRIVSPNTILDGFENE